MLAHPVWTWNIIVTHGVFIVIPLQRTFLVFSFSLDCGLSTLPKGECHLFCNDNLFSSLMSGCIKICPFMFISAIRWNRGSTFAKPSLSIHVLLWLYSEGNLRFFFLYYKGFHYTFSSSCNPNLPVLSQTNHSRSRVEIWKGDFSQLLILPKGCLWGFTKGFFGMYFRLLRELKRDLCICSIEEKLLP